MKTVEVTATNKILVKSKISQLDEKCFQIFGFRISPVVLYDLTGRCAGRAISSKNTIRLNGQLLNENKDAFINDTVVHEYVHLIQRKKYGSLVSPHGSEFYSIGLKMGTELTRCHSFKTESARKVTKFVYVLPSCGCSNIEVGKSVHNKIQCEISQYHCRKHGTKILPNNYVGVK